MPELAQKTIWEKVVIRFGSETVKGYLECQTREEFGELFGNHPVGLPAVLRIRRLGDEQIEEIPTAEAKAIFYVRDFDGNAGRTDIRFHTRAPIAHGIWIRVEFLDGEVMEGIVHNTIRYLVDPGFFMWPTDPDGNNQLVYVMKSWLRDHSVLGVRKLEAAEFLSER